jgi:golgi-specific brefeldin A-resistance guanine nucleotide exchange factor 1
MSGEASEMKNESIENGAGISPAVSEAQNHANPSDLGTPLDSSTIQSQNVEKATEFSQGIKIENTNSNLQEKNLDTVQPGETSAAPTVTFHRSSVTGQRSYHLHRDCSNFASGPLESCMENSVRIVKGEIHNVLSLMRLNRRYSSGARFIREIPATAESPLVRGLKDLHDSLATFTDLQEIDTLLWLRPFFDVIESPETSGPITGGALSSLSKFLLYGFLHPNSPRAAEAINAVCYVVTRCRFERTDHSGDEVVLMRILQVLLDCLRCPAGTLLTDQNVWDMVQSCYDIGRQPRLSELLQRAAEHILMQVTLTIYARFSELQAAGNLSQDMNRCSPLRDASSPSVQRPQSEADTPPPEDGEERPGFETAGPHSPPYGMPCMLKVLEFFCKLTNPGDSPTDPAGEARRMLALALVNVVLETGGRQLSACPALVAVIQHELSRNLLQNSRTTNLPILSLTLRVVFNMFNSVREHMKVQLEVFFNSIHLAESPVYEVREMALESLLEFCREPQLMVDIYTNYDCDVQVLVAAPAPAALSSTKS